MKSCFNLVLVIGLLFTSFARPTHAQTSVMPLGQATNVTATLFLARTRVHISTPSRWRDLESLNPVFLQRNADSALLLVDDAQLERLTRMRFMPEDTNELTSLASVNATVAASMPTLLSQAANTSQVAATTSKSIKDTSNATSVKILMASARQSLDVAMHALDAMQLSTLANATSADADLDGLTDTQEGWWCTDTTKSNSNLLGSLNDGRKVQQARDWVGNLRAGPPDKTPFIGWPMVPANIICLDGDQDGVPDFAEKFELGLNPSKESTPGDRFDDGQKLWGTTPSNWGGLPRTDYAGFTGYNLPSWVKAPGNHPLVAAYPEPKIEVVQSSFVVKAVTTIQTERTVSENEEHSYSTSKTEGTSTSVADTVTWNEWQEFSETTPVAQYATLRSLSSHQTARGTTSASILSLLSAGTTLLSEPTNCAYEELQGTLSSCGKIYDRRAEIQDSFTTAFRQTVFDPNQGIWKNVLQVGKCVVNGSGCIGQLGQSFFADNHQKILDKTAKDAATTPSRGQSGNDVYYLPQQGTVFIKPQYQISYPVQKPYPTRTDTKGASRGGAQTTTHGNFQQHTVQNGQQFGTTTGWSNATAINTGHAADFWFSYKISNSGTDYLTDLCSPKFNIYIGDDPNSITTYFVANDMGADSCFHNLKPGDSRSFTVRTSTHAIALSLDELKQIDLGVPVRVVVADYSFGNDQAFYDNARSADVLVAIEDGNDDGDENIDTYLIPTWGDGDTMQNVIGRYFPNQQDAQGNYIAIWTPETRNDIPSWCIEPRRYSPTATQLWCKHVLSTADWWNIYLNNLGDGTGQLNQTLAAPNGTAFFRFNKDTDLDGYSDRTERALGYDLLDAASHPRPELIAGVTQQPAINNVVTATVSLLNTGFYDAYGTELVMVAPDDSISILNNTVGGSGRVRSQRSVIVGSRIKLPDPLPGQWGQTGHAKPALGGYYIGSTDRTYTFVASCANPGGCDVGSGTLTLNWSDGQGATGALNSGSGYASPTPLTVGALGLQLTLLTGKVYNNDTFTVVTSAPQDTFSYRINRTPYTEPLVIASYNDPQGNHRFALPPVAMHLVLPTDNLRQFSGGMLPDPGINIVTSAPFAPGTNSVNLLVNNPADKTLVNAHLFLELINVTGTVVSKVPTTVTLPPGPKMTAVPFDSTKFNPTYAAGEDYIVMAFLTDYQGNILGTSGRPLSSFQADPLPKLAADDASLTWNFGTVKSGTLLKHPLVLANTGFGQLFTYVPPAAGLALNKIGGTALGAADQSSYELTLRTTDLPPSAYDQTISIATSDPLQPSRSLRVFGSIVNGAADSAGGVARPLDVPVPFGAGLQGTWQTFNHTLGPDPASLQPVKVYSANYGTLLGLGRFATDFGAGTASAEMFGDGRDGAMPPSGNLNDATGFAAGVVNAGSAGSTSINVTDASSIARINPGDVVLIHQTQGAGAGQWELNKAGSDFTGSGTFSLQKPLQYTYSTSGNNRAQILRVPQYATCNVTGTVTPLGAWNGSWGGIFAVMCSQSATISGVINGSASGFRGTAHGAMYRNQTGVQGEGNPASGIQSISNNGNGGGGGQGQQDAGGGGGGGNGTSGTTGHESGQNNRPGGIGGSSVGIDTLTNAQFGGAGGEGGADDDGGNPGAGGNGGGLIVLISANVMVTGPILSSGANGAVGCQNCGSGGGAGMGDGGGGAGGSIMIRSRTMVVGNSLIQTLGGLGGRDPQEGGNGWGGDGGAGRIRLEYCESLSGSTSPSASTQKLNCYIADQAPSNAQQGQLNIPSNTAQTYQIQYGHKLNFASAGSQLTQLRIAAGLLSSITLQSLVSGVTGNTSFSVDIGDDGTSDWSNTISNNSTITSTDLSSVFNAYWVSHGASSTGSIDVPVRISLGGVGQVLLTNIQTQSANSALRYLKLTARTYSQFLLDFSAGGGGNVFASVDIGNDGSVDWSAQAANVRFTTGDLKNALNTYLSGKSGEVEVPIRFYVTPSGGAKINDYTATYAAPVDLVPTNISVTQSSLLALVNANDTATNDMRTVQATVQNSGSTESGPFTAAFFATAEGWGDWYIGSAFVANLSSGGSTQVSVLWNTSGFGGSVPVKVVVNPYGRASETNTINNTKSTTATVNAVKTDQTITFNEIPARLYTEPPFTINAMASSGLSVTFTSSTPSICAIGGATSATITLIASGTCTIRASQAGNAFINAAMLDRSFAVLDPNKASQMITFGAVTNKTFGDAPFAVSVSASSGLLVSLASQTLDICTAPTNATVTLLAAGTCTLRATQSGDGTYNEAPFVERSFLVMKANQTITFGALANKILSDTPFTISASTPFGLPITFKTQSPAVCSVSGNTVTLISVGQCSIEASQVGNTNVNPATVVMQSFTVSALLPSPTPPKPSRKFVYLPVVRR